MDSSKRPLIGLAGVITLAMATELNEQVSAQALPNIIGGLGMSHDPGTWFTSVFSSAVIMGMAIAPWIAVTFSLRYFALFVCFLGIAPSIFIPFTDNLTLLYGLRVFQGLATGFTVPLLMTTALRVLAPPIRLYGLAAYATTATFFPNLSTAFAGLWTDLVAWQFVFFQSIPLCTLAALLIWYGMPQDPLRFERFAKFDWRGALLVLTIAICTGTMLEQGDRLDWFNSNLICVLALASVVAIPLLVLNEWHHELPLFKIQLLARRNFAYGAITLFVFVIVASTGSSLPAAFLQEVAGYRPEQVYLITIEVAALQLIFLPLMAVVLNWEWVDSRIVSFIGMSLVLTACIGDSFMTVEWNRDEFYLWQGLQALGDAMIVMPLLMMATNSVIPQEGPFASGLVNTPRAVSETIAPWLVELVHRWRGGLHSNRLADQLGRERFRTYQAHGVSWQHPAPLLPNGTPAAPGSIAGFHQEFAKQAAVLTLSDDFLVFSGLIVFLMVLVLTLPQRTYPPRIVLAKK
jgi:MFS transporter, DHA2 family, multidrug resistance protein